MMKEQSYTNINEECLLKYLNNPDNLGLSVEVLKELLKDTEIKDKKSCGLLAKYLWRKK